MDSTLKVIEFVTPKNKYTIFYYTFPVSFGSPHVYINNTKLKQVNSIKYLGIVLDNKLAFKEHNTHRRKMHETYILPSEIGETRVGSET